MSSLLSSDTRLVCKTTPLKPSGEGHELSIRARADVVSFDGIEMTMTDVARYLHRAVVESLPGDIPHCTDHLFASEFHGHVGLRHVCYCCRQARASEAEGKSSTTGLACSQRKIGQIFALAASRL